MAMQRSSNALHAAQDPEVHHLLKTLNDLAASSADTEVESVIDRVGTRNLATLSQIDDAIICKELETRQAHHLSDAYLTSCRFQAGIVYTHVGDILIAVNPFRELPDYYRSVVQHSRPYVITHHAPSDDVSKLFTIDREPPPIPHIYRTSLVTYKALLSTHRNQVRRLIFTLLSSYVQCCVVSGESGAGKV